VRLRETKLIYDLEDFRNQTGIALSPEDDDQEIDTLGGLVVSLRSAAESAGISILVDVPAGAGYPPEISAAVYWSCVEAMKVM